ncbi:MAG: PIN domain-containing protein [Nitrospira sp. LK70]|nr:PIN domain-containing protein [Nitrospira sp. LK70]
MFYWDTSALVKQYITEQGTEAIQQWQAESAATSMIAFTEVHSAVMRRRRDGTLSESIARSILRAFRQDWSSYLKVPVHEGVITRGAALIERHKLRTLDAIHLASALGLREEVGEAVELIAADGDLLKAASAEGLVIYSIRP